MLELRSCGIGDEGAIAISSALIARRGYAPLAHLVLSFNKDIGEAGVDAAQGSGAVELWKVDAHRPERRFGLSGNALSSLSARPHTRGQAGSRWSSCGHKVCIRPSRCASPTLR